MRTIADGMCDGFLPCPCAMVHGWARCRRRGRMAVCAEFDAYLRTARQALRSTDACGGRALASATNANERSQGSTTSLTCEYFWVVSEPTEKSWTTGLQPSEFPQ
jgi:hypothetical protein